MAFGEGKNRRQTTVGKGALGRGMRIATGAERPRNDIVFTRGAVQVRAGRCGERTERCRWQKQRSERVAAVKILSVRRKAAQKFWAPQQDHRPLRKRYKGCNGRATARVAPTKCCDECVDGVSALAEVF